MHLKYAFIKKKSFCYTIFAYYILSVFTSASAIAAILFWDALCKGANVSQSQLHWPVETIPVALDIEETYNNEVCELLISCIGE